MAQYFELTGDMLEHMIKDFRAYLSSLRVIPDEISYKKKSAELLKPASDHITILYSQTAWIKQMMLVMGQKKEIAWYGLVERQDKTYYIKDLLVYPQSVTAATVTTDLKVYPEWYASLSPETIGMQRLQGHSHVNFAASPSGDDKEHYEEILQRVPQDSFYIFMIWNKDMESYIAVYDFASHIYYNKSDITVEIEGLDISAFASDVKKKIESIAPVTPKYTPKAYSYEFGGDEWDDYDEHGYPKRWGLSYGKDYTTPPKGASTPAAKKYEPVTPPKPASVPARTTYDPYDLKFGKKGK